MSMVKCAENRINFEILRGVHTRERNEIFKRNFSWLDRPSGWVQNVEHILRTDVITWNTAPFPKIDFSQIRKSTKF